MARRGKGPRGTAAEDNQQQVPQQKAAGAGEGDGHSTEAHSSSPQSQQLSEQNGSSSSSCNGEETNSSVNKCCDGKQPSQAHVRSLCSSSDNPSSQKQQQQTEQQPHLEQELVPVPHSSDSFNGGTRLTSLSQQQQLQLQQLQPQVTSQSFQNTGAVGEPCLHTPQQQNQFFSFPQQLHQTQLQSARLAEEGRGETVTIPVMRETGESSSDADRVLRRQLAVDTAAARARKKLLVASAVCLVFMAIEVVAGIAANSLALMTDASHLLSDLCAFLISLFALWVSQLKGTLSMSFGYHRAEILGALLSVLLIWGVTAALVVAALQRIAAPEKVEGGLMLLTASIGTAANLFMAHILHIHSHGIGRIHTGHGAEVEGAHSSSSNSNSGCCADNSEARALSPVRSAGCCGSSGNSSSNNRAKNNSYDLHGHDKNDARTLLLQKGPNDIEQQQQTAAAAKDDVYVRMEEDPETEIESMNLRAAYIHALGDLLQNIGVMIASAIIWYNPEYSIADPACTLLFSMFVILTTISIIREAVNVLMEGTPVGLDVAVLQSDLVSLRGVLEVHDLHVWSISIGRPALACHLVVCDEEAARRVLRAATLLCQRKHGILHTTIQTDFSSDASCCDTEAHQKCMEPITRAEL
ncbi:cation efflux family protein, putative [Eimeria necatrix]|uniref:Cation efflux family protein, putative n=1 Tax=Eimeria necatrix TaxID=51315 RepID=U6MP61_9EIME|nr:cation efflux family protein, putative [Eimeria necatrix]CDJ63450.1 cation efflux family protein, putative [Eimeria necatrix]